MDFSLTPQQKELRQRIIRFAQEQLNDNVIGRDRERIFSRQLWKQCASAGLLGIPAPTEFGGLGQDALTTALALEAFGYGCHDAGLVFAVGAHMMTSVLPLVKVGSPEQKRKCLPGLIDGTLIGVNAMTEAGTGSDAFALATTAVADGDTFRLNGKKRLISNIPEADLVIIYAVTDASKGFSGGTTAFLVEKSSPGYSAAPPYETMGLRTSQLGELTLENVRVGKEAILGGLGAGSAVFTTAMDWERVCLLASHLGTMDRLLERSIHYARSRKQFGQPIGKFQGVAHRIADMKIRVEAARMLVYRAAAALDTSPRLASLDASIAKVFVSEAYQQTALDAVQVHGGQGYLTANELERSVRDAVASTIYSGTSEMQRNMIARWLGL